MCIYALYRYNTCQLQHPLGNGPRGGRAFRIRPCKLNDLASDELKDTNNSKHRIYDHALPCEGEEYRIFYVDQICHVCNPRLALAAGYPLNRNYALTVAHVLEWSIPYSQMKCDDLFREISYTNSKKDVDEEQPVSPKDTSYNTAKRDTEMDSLLSPRVGPPILPGGNDRAEKFSVQGSVVSKEATQRTFSTASNNSTSSQNELRPRGLQARPAPPSPHQVASVSPSSEHRVRVGAPVPFEMHPGDTILESY